MLRFGFVSDSLGFIVRIGDEFRTRVDKLMRAAIRKAIPSVFRDVRPLYSNPAKLAIVESLIVQYVDSLRASLHFSPSDASKEAESPSCLLWALFLAGNHFDHLNQHDRALAYCNQGIEHTPTTIDFHILRGRIYKHVGDFAKAFENLDHARSLDLADRYINTKCVRYAHRNDDPETAEKLVSLFLRDGENLNALFDLQVMWYEVSAGEAYLRAGNFAMALKNFLSVDKHFEDIQEDQFDFHTYCLRKVTLRSYINMIRFADNMRSHRFYYKAARSTVRAYLALQQSRDDDVAELAALASVQDAEERKRLEKQRKKRLAKAAKEAEALAAQRKVAEKDKKPLRNGEIDEDPYGEALVKVADPLLEATKFVRQLQLYCPKDIDTHVLAAQVYIGRQKYVLALQAVKRAAAIDPSHPQVLVLAVRLFSAIDKAFSSLDPTVQEVIKAERESAELLGGACTRLPELVNSFLEKHKQSLPHRVAVAKALHVLHGADAAVRTKVVALASDLSGSGFSYQDAIEAHKFLLDTLSLEADATKFKQQAQTKFPMSPYFSKSDAPASDDSKAQ